MSHDRFSFVNHFLTCARRRFHTRFPSAPTTKEQKCENAKRALLAFNIMISQGRKPDVGTYTKLIYLMGQGDLEWQAYKLFARMLDQGLDPIPQTYAALKIATNPKRHSLLRDIELKMKDSIKSFPAELAQDLSKAKKENKLKLESTIKQLSDGTFLGNSDTGANPASVDVKHDSAAIESSTQDAAARGGSYATVSIENPALTWDTFRTAQERRKSARPVLSTIERDQAHSVLETLHDEELRILLTIHRQLRHGTRSQMISSICDCLPLEKILELGERRKLFFSTLRGGIQRTLHDPAYFKQFKLISGCPTRILSTGKEVASVEVPMLESGTPNNNVESGILGPEPNTQRGQSFEKAEGVQGVLLTPWGYIKEPISKPPPAPSPINPERTIVLSDEEILSVQKSARTGTLDMLPLPLLRRYARQFHVKWKRKFRTELYENIVFHVQHFSVAPDDSEKPDQHNETPRVVPLNDSDSPEHSEPIVAPTPFEVLKTITRYAAEVQVVDKVELTKKIQAIQRRRQLERQQFAVSQNKSKEDASRDRLPLLTEWQMKRANIQPLKLPPEIEEEDVVSSEALKETLVSRWSNMVGVDRYEDLRRTGYKNPPIHDKGQSSSDTTTAPWENDIIETDSYLLKINQQQQKSGGDRKKIYSKSTGPLRPQTSSFENINEAEVDDGIAYLDRDGAVPARANEYEETYFGRFRKHHKEKMNPLRTTTSREGLLKKLADMKEKKKKGFPQTKERKTEQRNLRSLIFLQGKKEERIKQKMMSNVISKPRKMAFRM